LYGCSQGSVRQWIKKFGKNHLLNKIVRIQTMDESSRISELNKQIEELKVALADAHIDQKLAESRLKVACQKLDVDPEEFKKKPTSGNHYGPGNLRGNHKRTMPTGGDFPSSLLPSLQALQKEKCRRQTDLGGETRAAAQAPQDVLEEALPSAEV